VASIPAVCESCGTLFVSHNAVGGKGTTAGDGERVGPCPTCGARWGRVIDGPHELAEDLAGYLGSPDLGTEVLGELQKVIGRVRAGTAEPEVAAEEIRHRLPQVAGVAWLLSARGETLTAWLALLDSILALLVVPGEGVEPAPISPEQIDQVVRDVEGPESEDVASSAPGPAVSTKVARNAPCPCGSGDKYKHCHGRDQTVKAG
jgi:SEC-C motif